MTPKTRILELRAKGLVYREIAEQLGMSVNTVKSICNRNKGVCKNCGTALVGRKEKIFCSGKCRLQWWYAHSTNRGYVPITCAHCGKEFMAYPSKARKYCSHTCYIQERFGGEEHD